MTENAIQFDFRVYRNYSDSIIHSNMKCKLHPEYQYLDNIEQILTNGNNKNDRTGIGTRSIFGMSHRFNIEKSFPLLTTKKTASHTPWIFTMLVI